MYGRLVDEGRGIVLYPFLPIKILIEGTKGGKLSCLGTLTIYLLVVAVISIILNIAQEILNSRSRDTVKVGKGELGNGLI